MNQTATPPTNTPPTEQSPTTGRPDTGATPRSRRARSWFWPGFATGFLLLNLLTCGGLFWITGAGRLNLGDLQNTQVSWAPPQVTPTPDQPAGSVDDEPAPDEAAPATGGRFQVGDQPNNITGSRVNIRREPGYLGKSDGDVLGQLPPGGGVEILGDRATADNLTWWRVRYVAPDGGVIEGWIAEATASGVQILAP